MDKAKKSNVRVEKVGVAWNREFKNKKTGLKISLNGEIFVAYKNTKKVKDTDVDYVICKFIDFSDKKEAKK